MSNRVEFPRQPYEGQRRLSESIYSACEQGETAIFESPTGTGKSLAVLCGSLSYLKDNSFDRGRVVAKIAELKREYEELSTNKTLTNEDKFKQMHTLRCQIDDYEEQMHVQSQIERRLVESTEEAMRKERQQYASDNDENLVLSNQESDDIEELGKRIKKLIYVSRTHSQLTQFIREMDNPIHRFKRPVQVGSRASLCINANVNTLPSALVNCECSRLVKNSSGDIEDIDLRDDEPTTSTKRAKRETCPFYKRSKILELRSQIWKGALLDPKTSLKEEGQRLGACPFFAAKAALPLCDVVAMPYNVLFDKISRDSYGVNLEDNVVIVDEAHNFLSTVYETASFSLNLDDLDLAKNALEFYMANTRSTKQDKLLAVRQIISALERFTGVLKSNNDNDGVQLLKPVDIQRDMSTTADYLKLAHLIDSGGLIRESRGILSRYWASIKSAESTSSSTDIASSSSSANKLSALAALVRQSKAQQQLDSEKSLLPVTPQQPPKQGTKRIGTPVPNIKDAKIRKFSYEPSASATAQQVASQSPVLNRQPVDRLQVDGVQLFGSLIKLFRALLQSDSAKFIYQAKERKIRYIRLDIDSDLQKVIKNSKAFIMVGGTMRPRGYISSVLKSSCLIPSVVEEQFGHVIAERNLLPLVVSTDAQNNSLNLKVSQLNDAILDRYARTLNDLLLHIPHGCVVFLPNYNLIMVFEKLLRALKPRKQIFAEKRGQDVEDLIRKYTQFAQASRDGAVLLASAGGRLGEGINFADNLARAVVMIGLPYPNAMDVETKLRASHAVEQELCSSEHNYLSQACVRVVAQCMGRAIRHANDFAALIFMDSRYERTSNSSPNEVVSNLPEWMVRSLKTVHTVEFPTIFQRFFNPLMLEFNKEKHTAH